MKTIALLMLIVAVITGCDGGRYSAAKSHVTGKVCYVYDWQTDSKLPATDANIRLASDMFWADPETCRE